MSVELHLPDLPEVPISLGPLRSGMPRARLAWHLRLRAAALSYLPLLLMALLALASWWLVKNSPRGAVVAEDKPVSSDPDYTMTQFALERFDAGGKLKLRIEGESMRHFPAADRFEIDVARIKAVAPDGHVTLAHARHAIGNGDGSEVQLWGAAEVSSTDAAGVPLLIQSEFLHAFFVTERLKSHMPVLVRSGASELTARGMEYDHVLGRLELKGPLRAVLTPRVAPRGVAKAQPAAKVAGP